MVEEVKYIRFEEVPEAPRIAVPVDFTQDQIAEYLKSDYVEQQFAEKGFENCACRPWGLLSALPSEV